MSSGEVLMTAAQISDLTGIILGARPAERPASRADALAAFHAAAATAGIVDVERFLGRSYAVASEELHAAVTAVRAAVPAPARPRKGRAPRAAAAGDPAAKTPSDGAKAAPAAERGPTKRQVLLNMVLAPTGATEAELCAAVGWKACLVTLRRAAADAGVKLRGERAKGEKTRWFGARA